MENLKEELFHAWQDAYYSGGTAQYGKDAQGNKLPGLVNVEFEAKVFQDIIEGPDAKCCYGFRDNQVPDEIYNNYYLWIESIRFTPDRSFSNSDYTKWLNLFNLYESEYSSATSNDLQYPLALRDLIGNSNCF